MAGENKPAIEMRNKLTKYIDNYVNNNKKYYYVELYRNDNRHTTFDLGNPRKRCTIC